MSPKTKPGRRQIQLGHETLKRLEAHRVKQEKLQAANGNLWTENSLMFTNSLGTFLDDSKVSKEFKKVLKKTGLPDIRFHDLRHTSISFLLEMGTPINTVQQRSGHSKASVTTDIYGHSIGHSQEEAAEKIEEKITPVAVDLQ